MAHKYFYDHKKISLVFKFFLTYANLYILYTHNFLKEMNRRLHQKTIFFKIFTNPSWRKIGPENYHRSCVSIYTLYPSSCCTFSKQKNSSYIFVVKTLPPLHQTPQRPSPFSIIITALELRGKFKMSIDHFHPQSRALK